MAFMFDAFPSYGWNANTLFQSFFMSTTVQPALRRLVERLVELADVRLRGRRRIRARRRCGARAPMKRAPAPAAVHCEHLQVAVGVAEGEDRPAADEAVDADRLAGAVVDELDLRQLHQHRLAVRASSNLRHAAAADDLLGRDAVDLLGPRRA